MVGLQFQVHRAGVPRRYRARWLAPAKSLHRYGGSVRAWRRLSPAKSGRGGATGAGSCSGDGVDAIYEAHEEVQWWGFNSKFIAPAFLAGTERDG